MSAYLMQVGDDGLASRNGFLFAGYWAGKRRDRGGGGARARFLRRSYTRAGPWTQMIGARGLIVEAYKLTDVSLICHRGHAPPPNGAWGRAPSRGVARLGREGMAGMSNLDICIGRLPA